MNEIGIDTGMITKLLSDPEALGRVMRIAGSLRESGALDGIIGKDAPADPSSVRDAGENAGNVGNADSSADADGEDREGGAEEKAEEKAEENTGRNDRAGKEGYNGTPYRKNDTGNGKRENDRREGRKKIGANERIRLLEAIRPFLSSDKQDKLTVVIRLIGLAEAAGGIMSGK